MNKWYIHIPESVLENETHTFLVDFKIQTDHLISARRPDRVIVNNNKKKKKEKKENLPNSGPQSKIKRSKKKKKKKKEKKNLRHMKVTMIPIVIIVHGTIPKRLIT